MFFSEASSKVSGFGFVLSISILIVYLGNVVQVQGDVVAAAQAAASIDNQRYNSYQTGSLFPIARPPQRRQYYHRTRPQYTFPLGWLPLSSWRYQQGWRQGHRRQTVRYPSQYHHGSSSNSHRNTVRRQRKPQGGRGSRRG